MRILIPILLASLVGCSTIAGHSNPKLLGTDEEGNPIIGCEMKGFAAAIGDGVGCGNTGGELSENGADFLSGAVDSALGTIGGVFTGVGAAITPDEE